MRDLGGQDASYPGTIPPHPECVCGHLEGQHHGPCRMWTGLRRATRCPCPGYQEAER